MLNKNQKNCGRNLKDVSVQLKTTVGFAAPDNRGDQSIYHMKNQIRDLVLRYNITDKKGRKGPINGLHKTIDTNNLGML